MKCSLSYRLVLLFVLLRSPSIAQVFLPAIGQPSTTNSFPPKNPTISAVTPLWKGVLIQANMEELSGPVVEVKREDVLPEGAVASPSRETTVLKFDGEGHLIESTYQDSRLTTTITSVFQNGKPQSRTRMRRYPDGKFPDWQESWEKWGYDQNGRVSDYRRAYNNQENNHYLNFKYDTQGRLLSCEYRQDGSDKPFSFYEFKYEGKTVISDTFDESHKNFFEQVQVLDGSNHVIELSISDLNSGTLKLWYHTTFKYDDQGRLTEQNTDKYNYAPGDVDSEPPPGRVAIQYDDKKHTGEQDFYGAEGKLIARSVAEFDAHGYVVKQQTLDANLKQPDFDKDIIWTDPKTHQKHSGAYAVEAIYDDHGNWTTLQSWFTPDDGGDRILTRSIKQAINYR
jgi:hypothetical protein